MERIKISKNEFKNLNCSVVSYVSRNNTFFKKVMVISAAVPDDIISLFGKCDFTHRGEYNCQIWSFIHKNMKFFVVSANGRGTTVEAEVDIDDIAGPNTDVDKINIIIDFINIFYDRISELESPRIKRWLDFN